MTITETVMALLGSSSRRARNVATSTIQASEAGISTFQPNFMNWS